MTWLLGPAGRARLRGLTEEGALLAFDFDGTLAPIVADHRAAALRPRSLALLRGVAERYTTIVLTGRARADAVARLPGVHLASLIGSHGAEGGPATAATRRWTTLARGWAAALQDVADTLPGVEIEDKGISVTAHYRGAANPALAKRRLQQAAEAMPAARVLGGKRVVNVLPADAPDKGDALAAAARRLGAQRLLFVGDDETDEEAFGAEVGVPAIMARVGLRRGSRAPYHLRDQAEVDRLLDVLLEQSQEARGPASRRQETLPAVLTFLRALRELEHAQNARSKRMLADGGVSGPQRLVLRALGLRPGSSPAEVARLLHLHPASATRLVAALVRRSLVARGPDPADSRRQRLRLTPGGRRIDAARGDTVEAAVQDVLERFPSRGVEQALAVISALAAALRSR